MIVPAAMHKSVRFPLLLALTGCGTCGDDPAQPAPDAEAVWIRVSAGVTEVGSPSEELCRDDDESPRAAQLAAFSIAKYEVTQAAFQRVTDANPSFRLGCPACPVERVTYAEAQAYCKSAGGRLPTEEEWERAARAGTTTPFYGGALKSCMATDPVADRIGWYKANSGGFTQPVGGKAPNGFGLYDMSGNVYEWTSTREGSRQVVRGGSWYHNAHHARSANRMTVPPEQRLSYVGFRCVTDAEDNS